MQRCLHTQMRKNAEGIHTSMYVKLKIESNNMKAT